MYEFDSISVEASGNSLFGALVSGISTLLPRQYQLQRGGGGTPALTSLATWLAGLVLSSGDLG